MARAVPANLPGAVTSQAVPASVIPPGSACAWSAALTAAHACSAVPGSTPVMITWAISVPRMKASTSSAELPVVGGGRAGRRLAAGHLAVPLRRGFAKPLSGPWRR